MQIDREKYSIRNWQVSDSDALARHMNNINIWSNLRDSLPFPYTKESAISFLSINVNKEKPLNFAIEIDGEAIGGIGYIPQQDIERLSAEIGYWIAEPYWGKNIMSGVVRDFAKYIFENTDIIRLFAITFDNNIGSQRVLEKAGFNKLCIMRKAVIKNGRILDVPLYELIKPE